MCNVKWRTSSNGARTLSSSEKTRTILKTMRVKYYWDYSNRCQPNITSFGNLTLPASLTITNGTTPISMTNTTSSSSFNATIQNSGGAQDIGSTTAHQLALRTNEIVH
ncbi:unnamed protein product [Phytophthora lilii]|uniref:Unnamed protein product n=1 Tax=Phytophthora lilii TaxID=2077276 RepID=A0A9W6TKP9_9STRA|nr:unnamed protein product [Phytophthora lilii]